MEEDEVAANRKRCSDQLWHLFQLQQYNTRGFTQTEMEEAQRSGEEVGEAAAAAHQADAAVVTREKHLSEW